MDPLNCCADGSKEKVQGGAALARMPKRGPALLVRLINVSPVLHEHLANLLVPACACEVQRRHALLVYSINSGPMLQQHADHWHVT